MTLIHIFTRSVQRDPEQEMNNERGKEDLELPLFDLDAISNATDNFSTKPSLDKADSEQSIRYFQNRGSDILNSKINL